MPWRGEIGHCTRIVGCDQGPVSPSGATKSSKQGAVPGAILGVRGGVMHQVRHPPRRDSSAELELYMERPHPDGVCTLRSSFIGGETPGTYPHAPRKICTKMCATGATRSKKHVRLIFTGEGKSI